VITSLELLDTGECRRVEDQLKELREHWIPRGSGEPAFFTLGAASYLDEPADYRAHAARLNPVLRDRFAWLYERVADFLARRLGAPVTFADGLAVPGFHVWLSRSIFVTPVASVHFDLQYLRAWPETAEGVDYDHPLSFTLPIRLPHRGGGLNVWDVDYARFRRFVNRIEGRVTPADLAILLPRMRHPYTRGAIAMHSGHLMHQIGEIDEVALDDERITLQGHALCQHGEWKLYW
jgi:hypothetical protein